MNFYDRLKAKLLTKYHGEVNAIVAAIVLGAAYLNHGITLWAAIYYFFLSLAVGGIGGLVRILLQTKAAGIAAAGGGTAPGTPALMEREVQKMNVTAAIEEKKRETEDVKIPDSERPTIEIPKEEP